MEHRHPLLEDTVEEGAQQRRRILCRRNQHPLSNATKARQAQSRLKALERLPMMESVIEAAPTRFDFPEPAQLSPPILQLDRVDAGYDGRPILRNVSLLGVDSVSCPPEPRARAWARLGTDLPLALLEQPVPASQLAQLDDVTGQCRSEVQVERQIARLAQLGPEG